MVPAEPLEAEFLEPFRELVLSDEDGEVLEHLWHVSQGGNGEWTPRVDRAGLQARLERAKKLYLLGDLTEAEYVVEKRAVEEAEREALAALGPSLATTPRRLLHAVRQFGEVVREAEPQLQRQMTFSLYERIETDGLRITRAVPRPWFGRFFEDVAQLLGQ